MKVSIDINALKDSKKLIGSIDQGTSSSRFIVFTDEGKIAASAQVEHTQIYPESKPGWHEHDPLEIWYSVVQCVNAVFVKYPELELDAIGITNQRETTIAWNAVTGMPYYNAIVWDDVRTDPIAKKIAAEGTSSSNQGMDRLRSRTGLPLASYFSGTKVRWLIENVPQLHSDLMSDAERSNVRIGTIDTWLVYQLTGRCSSSDGNTNGAATICDDAVAFTSTFPKGNVGGLFVTDVTNASRTLFMDIETCEWCSDLVYEVLRMQAFPVETALAKIEPSSSVYGPCSGEEGGIVSALKGVPIASILGDQQAALFGQVCFDKGMAKCTYGTGLFLMMNTGLDIVPSVHGLLTTVAYKVGSESTVYGLEGSVAFSGSVIQWLRDQLDIISDAAESETLANHVQSNDGLYFVPAFAGLFAPYWRSDARGVIVGMTASHTKHHICRAALEATAYQAKEVFDAMYHDSRISLASLRVDGGAVANNLLMQFQADMLDAPVIKPQVTETTAMGAAFAAGLAVGVWKDLSEIHQMWAVDKAWKPTMSANKRDSYFMGWKKAVTKSFGWVEEDVLANVEEETQTDKYRTRTVVVAAASFLCITGLILLRSKKV
mmetsp:Transcript_17285/g.26944  ORF Transcript_17285/g.26944 Transcript_17285/m.26944 type:complete len:603 (-) Transcript_17285:161-1969(-)|eukprot:CAMPEP_0196820470 /NCGR_PEP_ID=MMETSP1362-20130617/75422_1 /TAXON_ID=163516 /ORGANISM="Leptocylindrus danicus, Strain CCMP1856" /LENGTH=602 /DNA_ID=CAMNT_0042199371 /DNA_START=201 /DNA_END=2009 /DNA_ORIENTATION=-